jgi:ketosteroid isomerase-like protein
LVTSDSIRLVQRAFEAFTHRDLEAMLGLLAPDAEFFPEGTSAALGEDRSYRGHDGMRRYFEDASRVWDELRVMPQRYRQVGDRVLVHGRVYARLANGFLIDSPGSWLWEVRDGKIVWGCAFAEDADALRAAGLEEGE